MRWRIVMLGGLRAESAGRALTRFRTQRTGALLAYLAFHRGRALAREVLAELHWPEAEPEAGRTSLRQALASLRRQLEPPGVRPGTVLGADRASATLRAEAVTTDVAELEAALSERRLEDALRLYGGELLPGVFDDWVAPERERLRRRFLDAAHERSEGLLGAGDLAGAADAALRAIAADPLDERARRDIMRVAAARGDPREALRHLRELTALLARELGAPPSAATRELARQVEAGRVPVSTTSPPAPEAPRAPRHTPPLRRGSLPLQLTRFIGREEDAARVSARLASPGTRLVTLTGPPGTGKTRLAIEVAAAAGPAFPEGAWFVPLAPIADARLVAPALAEAAGAASGPEDPLERIAARFAGGAGLIVLDNFEQLVGPEGAAAVREILARAPRVVCLVTSRRPLGVGGEVEVPLAPLAVPSGDALPGEGKPLPVPLQPQALPERLSECASVQLFVDRAQAVRPDFALTRANAAAVAELCARLDGLPLAIELAASRAQVLAPAQMVGMISRRFDLLETRRKDVEPRHRSLRAALDASCAFLLPWERRLFTRLGIFSGGFTLEAAEAVCGAADACHACNRHPITRFGEPGAPGTPGTPGTPGILATLEGLRECSLVTATGDGPERRMSLLETIRAYARELLPARERAGLAARHAAFYLGLAERAAPALTGPEQRAWLERLSADQENLRAALDWAGEEDPATGLRLAAALWRFWLTRGRTIEGRARIERALERAPAAVGARAEALRGGAILANRQGDAKAIPMLEEALAIFQEVGDERGAAATLSSLGTAASARGDRRRARALHEEALAIVRRIGDRRGAAIALANLASMARDDGDPRASRAMQEESIAALRDIGDRDGIANGLAHLAGVSCDLGLLDAALRAASEAIATFRGTGNEPGLAYALNQEGDARLAGGDAPGARAAYVEAHAIHERCGMARGLAYALSNLASAALASGDAGEAAARAEDAERRFRRIGDPSGEAIALVTQGDAARATGDRAQARALHRRALLRVREGAHRLLTAEVLEAIALDGPLDARAARLLGAAAALRESLGTPVPPRLRSRHESARAALAAQGLAAEIEAGHSVSIDDATDLALRED